MLLVANPTSDEETALFELRKFPLRGAGPCARVTNQLRGVEAALRLAEECPEDALLRLRQQSVRQAVSARTCVSAALGPNMGIIMPDMGIDVNDARGPRRQ